PNLAARNGYHNAEAASLWMDEINQKVNELLTDNDIITRWHVEIEGTQEGKYLSAVNLISYFQYNFTEMQSLNEVHQFVIKILQELLVKSNRVIQLAEKTLQQQAA